MSNKIKGIFAGLSNLIYADTDGDDKQSATNPGASPTLASGGAADKVFAELEAQVGGKTLTDVANAGPGPNLDQINVPQQNLAAEPKKAAAPQRKPDGGIDFTPIYHQAGLPSPTLTAEEVMTMLAELEGDDNAKRVMLRTMLGSLAKSNPGASPTSIINDAMMKLKALDSYTDGITSQLNEFKAKSQLAITQLETQIAEKKKAMENAEVRTKEMVGICDAEGDKFEQLLTFLGQQAAVGV